LENGAEFKLYQSGGRLTRKTIRRPQSCIASVPAQISSLRISPTRRRESESLPVSHRVMSQEDDFV
jgi:hypothetical protein